jgi:mannose-6-phosphate isomerase
LQVSTVDCGERGASRATYNVQYRLSQLHSRGYDVVHLPASIENTVARDLIVNQEPLSSQLEDANAFPRLVVLRVRPGVRHYAWGATEFIPSLIGVENPEQKPFAELWMGAHPDLPSTVEIGGSQTPLSDLIRRLPELTLGRTVAARFGELPYLFKVLSASDPLSIQVHPAKKQAEIGFARENAAGVPVSAPHRNYKDDNHKPEILVALTDFHALRGFRPLEEIGQQLNDIDELRALASHFEPTPAGLESLYRKAMTSSQEEIDRILQPLIARLATRHDETPFAATDREYWLLEAHSAFSRDGHFDRGLFSIFLLNLVHLRPGEAIYLPAGVLHAYLRGSGMELMANSNNVLRGGLTPKHVDVPELLANVVFEGEAAQVIRPTLLEGGVESAYETPAAEFELRRITLDAGKTYHSGTGHSADLVIRTDADVESDVAATAENMNTPLTVRRGEVFFASAGVDYAIKASGPATLFRAMAPP